MADQPRKRTTSEREPASTSTSTSQAHETTPMSPRAQNYDSITPHTQAAPAADDAPRDGTPQKPTDEHRRASAERAAAHVERIEGGKWRAFWEKYGSVELENKGSVARDHLALERTFLAWLRTSLSFASIGIAITQLFRLNTSLASHQHQHAPFPDPAAASPHGQTVISPQARLRHLGKPLGATFIGIAIVMLCIGFHRYFEAQHYVIRGKFPASRGSILVVSVIAGLLILSSLVAILVAAPSAFES